MALSQSTLASELAKMTPTASEASALATFAAAWDTYFSGSTVAGLPTVPGSYTAALAAMQSAMVGISAPGAGAAKYQAGVGAFWTTLSPLATVVWITAPIVLIPPIIPPAGISGLAAALTSVFATNTTGNVDIDTAANNIASVLHINGGVGGTVPGSVPPVVPAPIPIL